MNDTSASLKREEVTADKVAREVRKAIACDAAIVKGSVVVNFEVHFIDGGIRSLTVQQSRKVL